MGGASTSHADDSACKMAEVSAQTQGAEQKSASSDRSLGSTDPGGPARTLCKPTTSCGFDDELIREFEMCRSSSFTSTSATAATQDKPTQKTPAPATTASAAAEAAAEAGRRAVRDDTDASSSSEVGKRVAQQQPPHQSHHHQCPPLPNGRDSGRQSPYSSGGTPLADYEITVREAQDPTNCALITVDTSVGSLAELLRLCQLSLSSEEVAVAQSSRPPIDRLLDCKGVRFTDLRQLRARPGGDFFALRKGERWVGYAGVVTPGGGGASPIGSPAMTLQHLTASPLVIPMEQSLPLMTSVGTSSGREAYMGTMTPRSTSSNDIEEKDCPALDVVRSKQLTVVPQIVNEDDSMKESACNGET